MTKLFVYGSLRKGCFNHHYLEGIAEYKGLFYVKGDNFTLTNQKYPALILSDQNAEGKPEDLFTNPKEERTREFLQRYLR